MISRVDIPFPTNATIAATGIGCERRAGACGGEVITHEYRRRYADLASERADAQVGRRALFCG
jgi:hypothetical protein